MSLAEAPASAEESHLLEPRREGDPDPACVPEATGDKALGAFFALCTALAMAAAAVCVKLTSCSVLWLLVARCVGDTTLSTVALLATRRCAREGSESAALAPCFDPRSDPMLLVRGEIRPIALSLSLSL